MSEINKSAESEKSTKRVEVKKTGSQKNSLLRRRGKGTHKKKNGIGLLICAILATLSVVFIISSVNAGAEVLAQSYANAKDQAREKTKEKIYQDNYEAAEEKHHASNRVTIFLDNIEETKKLEVLNVYDVEYVIVEDEKNNIAWLEVPGKGVYVIDLETAEFSIDQVRKYVLVRVAYPELENVEIDKAKIQKLLFEKDGFMKNGNYKEGEELAQQMLDEAFIMIENEFLSNESFFQNAQEAARTSITNLVLQWNPDVEGLKVEVDFY